VSAEQWLPCLDGAYDISDLGRVRRASGGRGARAGRILKTRVGRDGYLTVSLSRRGNQFVHLLVAKAFLGPIPSGLEVNHIDGDKTNPRPSNLEYVTHSENCKHAHRLGLNHLPSVRPAPRPGMRNGRAKLTDDQVRALRSRHADGEPIKQLVSEFGIGKSAIDYIVRRVHWSHVA
jgi:hypothetical protein